MKLFLSSEGIPRPDLLKKLLGTQDKKIKVAVINNALDPYPENFAKKQLDALVKLFNSLGFQPTNIDLRKYEGATKELTKELRKNKLIWVSGGNSFWLRYVMKMSGFDTVIKGLLSEGIVYGGWSAGAVVAGPSLKCIELMDSVDKAPEIIWEGLNLVEYFIWPHWNKEKYKGIEEDALKKMKQLPYESLVLRDGEALVIEDDQRHLVK